MRTLRRILVLALISAGWLACAQVAFTRLPSDLQLVPRDTDSSGSVQIAGKSAYSGYQVRSLLVAVSTQAVIEDLLTSLKPDSTFSFTHHVPARLEQYEIRIYLKSGAGEIPVKTVKRLVSGDCFIIAGQSNALAASDVNHGGDQQFQNYSRPWLRGIGTHQDPLLAAYPCGPTPFGFFQANSNWKEDGFVGTWGLKLQADLAAQTGIPSCIINGAEPGSSLRQNLASQTPSNPLALDSCNIYDRLYSKAAHHRLNADVKLLFWYQGETDANLDLESTCGYINGFDSLYRSWKQDYPNIQKIILLQVNTGCNDNHLAQLREIQRRIAARYQDVCIVPTFSKDSSERSPDQCHYTLDGYNKIADRLLPLVKKFVYKSSANDQAIFPPTIKKAYYPAPAQLCLEFDRAIAIQASQSYMSARPQPAYLKDYFYGESFRQLSIANVGASGNKLYLDLVPGSVLPKKITYLPHSYTRIPTLYTGPWILNAANPDLPAVSFCNFPVSDSLDNGWKKTWTNFEDGYLGTHALRDKELFYTGDFDGKGGEELMCLYQESNGSVSGDLLSFENGSWRRLGGTPPAIGAGIFKDAKRILVADFDGDGKDELLLNGDMDAGEPATLLRYSGGNWEQVWSGGSAVSDALYPYRSRLCAGDFDGNGRAVLLGFGKGEQGGMMEFTFTGSGFAKGSWSSDASHALGACSEQLWPADYDGDGRTDLLGIAANGTQLLFFKQEGNWNLRPVNNLAGSSVYGDTAKARQRVLLAGNIDGDARQELIVLSASRSSSFCFLDLKPLNEHVSSWRQNHSICSPRFIDDCPADTSATAAYLLLRVKANEPKQLLSLRRDGCGYLANLYQFGGDTLSPFAYGSVDPAGEENSVLVRPNPSSGRIEVELPPRHANELMLFDLQGRKLLHLHNQAGTILLDLGYLQRGMYVIRVANSQQASSRKLVIER